jgi:hypothetical protein
MRVLVCGGREYADSDYVNYVLTAIQPDEICVGGARGADELARQWAHRNQVDYRVFPARWDIYGNAAGAIRNSRMLAEFKPDLVVAFPGGRGTAHMVGIARSAGVRVGEYPE